MRRTSGYHTKQRDAILSYIESLAGSHVTAAQIIEHFEKHAVSIGRTTVFRLLDRLTESGDVRRYNIDGVSGACYQYVKNAEACREHYHFKCESCGELLHFECETMRKINQHFKEYHDFQVNSVKTVMYGKCAGCLGQNR